MAWHSRVASREHAQASGMESGGAFARTDSPSRFLSLTLPPSPFLYLLLSPVLQRWNPRANGICGSKWPGRMKTSIIPYWPRETGNLPAPASESEIKDAFEMSQKNTAAASHPAPVTVGNIDFPGVGYKGALTVTWWKGSIHGSQSCLLRYLPFKTCV